MISDRPVNWELYLENRRLIEWARNRLSTLLNGAARYVPPEIIETLPEDAMIETCQRWRPGGVRLSTYYYRVLRWQAYRHQTRKAYRVTNAPTYPPEFFEGMEEPDPGHLRVDSADAVRHIVRTVEGEPRLRRRQERERGMRVKERVKRKLYEDCL